MEAKTLKKRNNNFKTKSQTNNCMKYNKHLNKTKDLKFIIIIKIKLNLH